MPRPAAVKRLIVNADDLGYSAGVDAGILRAHRYGIVTSASFMANQSHAERTAALVRGVPQLDVGVHLVITSGRPLSDPADVPSLVRANGAFRRPGGILGKGIVNTEDVLREYRAQFALARRFLGREPTHIDTHHWVEEEPAVLDAFVALASETGAAVRSLNGRIRERVRAAGIRTPDAYSREFQHAGHIDVASLLRILDGLGDGATELGCHPGEADLDLERRSGYAKERPVELATLTDPRVRAAIADRGIELTTFAAL
jgi:hypothetical protein